MFKIYFSKLALEDLKSIKFFISKDSITQSQIVTDKILLTISILSIFPSLWKVVDNKDSLRELVDSNYHFRIIYKVISNSVNIVSIFKYKNI